MPSQAEASEIMEQLLGTLPSNCEESDQELQWPFQASNAFYSHCNTSSSTYSSTNSNSSGSLTFVVPSEYGGYYLSDSNEALDLNSCTAPMHLHMLQEQGGSVWNKANWMGQQEVGKAQGSRTRRGRRRPRNRKARMVPLLLRMGKARVAAHLKMTRMLFEYLLLLLIQMASLKLTAGQQLSPKASMLGKEERINERLRILQNLVPNGTKVDISTMLEEAVQYVKFLQLQIKLLSYDEMWMYAPIAYNGMNIGVDLNLAQH
ncbi:unnamed protein product [Urochloa decumbens]|uniref:BHLH domain-containing protein n=1 Tax=Urochloa decumbens TaxID=240449 RepID=A0ABC9ALL4_9POAL